MAAPPNHPPRQCVKRGVDLFNEVCARDMEGIVAKLANAPYTPEATTWVKIKESGVFAGGGSGGIFRFEASSVESD
jgi:hypothetical protein